MTIRSALHGFYRRHHPFNDVRIWKDLPTGVDETILFRTDDYGAAEDWAEWDTTSSID